MSKQQAELWRIVGILYRKGYQDGPSSKVINILIKPPFYVAIHWDIPCVKVDISGGDNPIPVRYI